MNYNKENKKFLIKISIYLFIAFFTFTSIGSYLIWIIDVEKKVIFMVLLGIFAYFITLAITIYILKVYSKKFLNIEKELNKKIEKQLLHINHQHKHLINQSKFAAMGEMIAMIAHQWRQPLNVIILNLSNIKVLISQKKVKKSQIDSIMENINETVNYMNKTIDDFRDFLNKDGQKEDVQIIDLIYKPKYLIEAELEKIDINFLFESDINTNEKILIDKSKFFQVIMNIYKNSIDEFKQKKTINPSILVNITKKDNTLIIKITDNAGGIDSQYLQKIFDPYFSSKGKNGSGLGLYMSKRIIQEHLGGTIEAFNLDNGACFTISIPYNIERNNDLIQKEFKCFKWNKEEGMFKKTNHIENEDFQLSETKEIVNLLNMFAISYEITDNFDIKVNY